MKRIYNFSAGPAILPTPVLEEASRSVLEFAGSGMSILEVSHRGKDYESVHVDTRERLLRVLGLDAADYTVLFLGGGASLQFLMVPMNFLKSGETADYVHTGEWSSKAMKEASRFGNVHVAASSELDQFASIPTDFQFTAGARYVHLTTNNTIEGTEFSRFPDTGNVPLIVDASSDIFSRAIDYRRFALIYAGAQKNAGPAGVTLVVARKDFLEKANRDLPTMLAYETHAKTDSLFNTPPVFSIYVVNLVLKWVESRGGLKAMDRINERKSGLIYSALDSHPDVYETVVKRPEDRSWMNLTFRLRHPDREKEFLQGAEDRGMDGLKGHRLVGGLRASLYNAFPEEGCAALATYLSEFARR